MCPPRAGRARPGAFCLSRGPPPPPSPRGRSRRHPHKGQASRTRKGRKDFVTHKGDKYYNRRHHRQRGKHGRRPYTKKHRRRSGVRRVTIHEKRSRRTGRFVRGGARVAHSNSNLHTIN